MKHLIVCCLILIIPLGCWVQSIEPEEVLVQPKPLTVIPHPKFGFELVIIPAGTDIDGFTTTEPGLYIAGDALRSLLKDMGLVGDYIAKGQKGE